jgi:ribosomal protein S18 acetylase RimI-like enzyme
VPSELERALAFDQALRVRCAERIIRFRFGRAYFDDSHPRVWYLNVLVVDGTREVDPGELAAEAELLHTSAGQAHRRCYVPEDTVGAPLEPFFRRLGWEIERELFMVYRDAGERSVDTSIVEEVARVDLLPLREEQSRLEDWAKGEDDGAVAEVLDANRIWETAANARYFTVRVDGVPVAATDLYSDGRIAQVENVATLPAHRGRGYASALVLRVVEEAQAGGHDLVFLTADVDDWPKDLYSRLGFEEVGRTWGFLRKPARPAAT